MQNTNTNIKGINIDLLSDSIGEDIIKHRCLCCKKALISNTNFEVGHVISEKNGGEIKLENLKPICRACNSSMGVMNMNEYMKKYGFDKIANKKMVI